MVVLLAKHDRLQPGAQPAVSCESLAKLALPDTTITMAKEYAAGEYKAPAPRFGPPPSARGAPGVRRAANGQADPVAVVTRAEAGGGQPLGAMLNSTGLYQRPDPGFLPRNRDREAEQRTRTSALMSVLPVSGWNGKMIAVGGGGGIGDIGGLRFARGYAFANASDAGPNLGIWASPEKVIDFSYRAVHLMTVRAKEIIKAYYGSAPKHSYWFGHSAGGYEGLTEAARYPKDYDGIGIGWPPNPAALFNATQLWPNWYDRPQPVHAHSA